MYAFEVVEIVSRSIGFLVDVEFSFLNLVFVVVVELSFLRLLVLGGVGLDDVLLELSLVWFLEGLRLLDLIVLVWFLEELRLLDLMVLVWFLEVKLLGLINLVWFLVDFFSVWCSFCTSSIVLLWS
ncbi:hypothetical protein P8452_39486 [Trifolium repens]|nr:hypothetical protein P8452_39486 [Trifolium repens]